MGRFNGEEHKQIGKGTFGTVYALDAQTALKQVVMQPFSMEHFEEISRELNIVCDIMGHQARRVPSMFSDRIVKFHQCQVWQDHEELVAHIVMNRADCSLQEMFEASPNVPQWDVLDLCLDMKQALTFCHLTIGILIRDISPCNILKESSKNNKDRYVLCDFGKARPITQNLFEPYQGEMYSCDYHGAPAFQPPRAFFNESQRRHPDLKMRSWQQADWFSAGAVILCALCPSKYWSKYESYRHNHFQFASFGIKSLLDEHDKGIESSTLRTTVSVWIKRELEYTVPILTSIAPPAAEHHPASVVQPIEVVVAE